MTTGRTRKGSLPRTRSSETPIFDALLDEARQTAPRDMLSQEEMDLLNPLTDEDHRLAAEYLDAIDRLETEQDADVTDTQAHLINVVLIAAHCLRGEPPKTLAEWATYTGLPEGDIRAVATALQAVGLND